MAMIQTDAVVIGAGPVGLFQAFQLGLLGLRVHLVDVLPEPGGQCVALYPDKPIYDIPGVPVCTGRELTTQLLEQAAPFLKVDAATGVSPLHLGQQVMRLEIDEAQPLGQPRFHLHTTAGTHLAAKAVFVAAGAGAFVPKALPIPGLDASDLPANLHHHQPDASLQAPWAGLHLVIAGGGDEALHAVLDIIAEPLARQPARLTLLHRRDQFQAEAVLQNQVRDLIGAGRVDLALGVPDGCEINATQGLLALRLATAHGTTRLPLDHMLVRLGMSPKLGPLTDWGLALERKQVSVNPATFQSSLPGVYAVGDINTYPGKKRLLLCGFHEATLAAHSAAATLSPDAPQHLLYTTTSPLLHQRLGLI
jgi:thioredoxin reductase (NADPH)